MTLPRARALTLALTALLLGSTGLTLAGSSAAPPPARPDTDARLLQIVDPQATLVVPPQAASPLRVRLQTGVRNMTARMQPGSQVAVYLRTDSGRRYGVLRAPVGALAPGQTRRMTVVADLPDVVRGGDYQVRTCVERKLFDDCAVQPSRIVIKGPDVTIQREEGTGDFGTVEFGESRTETFTVRNEGDLTSGPIEATIVKEPVETPAEEDYAITSENCETLVRGKTCTIEVTYSPFEFGVESRAKLAVVGRPGGRDVLQLTGMGNPPVETR